MIHGHWRRAWRTYALIGLSSCGASLDDLDFNPVGGSNIRPLKTEEVTSIATALNNAEISAGRTVETRLTNLKVKALARQMIDSHTAANVRVGQLAAQRTSRFESPVVATLRDQSWTADRRLAGASRNQLDATYLLSEIKTQAQALTLINCTLVSPQRRDQLAVLMDQMRASVKSQLRAAIELRQELGLPDSGEATVIGCLAMCADPVEGESTPSLPEDLKATLCL
jgi:predicted outer membrane protein